MLGWFNAPASRASARSSRLHLAPATSRFRIVLRATGRPQADMPRLVDDTHPTAAEYFEDLVARNGRKWARPRGGCGRGHCLWAVLAGEVRCGQRESLVALAGEIALLSAIARPRDGDRAGVRPTVEEAAQVVSQGRGAGVTLLWLLLQAFQADVLQARGHRLAQARRRFRRSRPDLDEDIEPVVGFERRRGCQDRAEDGAERVDVGCRGDVLALAGGLLRGHVARRAEDGAAVGQFRCLSVQMLGEAEVGDLGHAIARVQDVAG